MTSAAAVTGRTVASVMTPVPVTVGPDTACTQLQRMRSALRSGGVPVVSPQGTLLGVVSEVDQAVAAGPDARVRDVMADPPAIVSPDTPVADITALAHGGAQRLYVVRDGKLLGIVARESLSVVMDADIAKQIERTVVAMLPDLDARCLRVTVKQGQVMLTGRVPWHRDVDACSRVATAIPGVSMVVNRLDYVWDDRPQHRWSVRHRK